MVASESVRCFFLIFCTVSAGNLGNWLLVTSLRGVETVGKRGFMEKREQFAERF